MHVTDNTGALTALCKSNDKCPMEQDIRRQNNSSVKTIVPHKKAYVDDV